MPKSEELKRFYLFVPEKQFGLGAKIRELLEKSQSHAHSEWSEGARDGDLFSETAQIDMYHAGDGGVQLYVVIDNNTNGRAELISVLYTPAAEKHISDLLKLLDEHDFVPKHTSFAKRPASNNCFGGYLDFWYQPASKKPFAHD